jgi:trehalose/maltose hydrolase-like predicted phosphorylase
MWIISEDAFDPARQNHAETLFTIGNGYLSTRGALEENTHGDCRATFVHGVFNDSPVVFSELANAPDWLPLEIFLDGERFSLETGSVRAYQRRLDLKTGLLTRIVDWVSPGGRGVRLTFERFASLADEHLLCLRVRAVPEYDGTIEFRAALNGLMDNEGFIHWQPVSQSIDEKGWVSLHMRTRRTLIDLALSMRLETSPHPQGGAFWDTPGIPVRTLVFPARSGEMVSVEKFVGIASSRESGDAPGMARSHTGLPESWDAAFEEHTRAWREEWEHTDILIEGDSESQLAVRFSLFQLLIAAPRKDDRVNIGAKTLSGFGYHGHTFWDTESFMLPVFIYTSPHIARNLLNYRWQRLPQAREKAHHGGYEGAQFPWESAASGDEVTPTWVTDVSDPRKSVRIWTGEIEIHISGDIAYAAHLYWKVTGDDEWFRERGAEIVLDTAKFWASRAERDAGRKRYQYTDVIGPDEYHEHVDNNFYTNYLARWNLRTGLEVYEWLKKNAPGKVVELSERLDLTPKRLETWRKISEGIYIGMREDGLFEQFEGYFQRRDVDLTSLEPRTVSAQVYFGIQGVQETQIIKQPDVMMLLYLMRDEFDPAVARLNYDYYTPRTDLTHGSSLGPSIQAALGGQLDEPQAAYENFIRSARADLHDVRGNAGDGIHGASAGGIWQAVVFGFAGLRLRSTLEGSHKGHWEIHPHLPAHWKRLRFHFYLHGKLQTVDIENS